MVRGTAKQVPGKRGKREGRGRHSENRVEYLNTKKQLYYSSLSRVLGSNDQARHRLRRR